MHTHHASVHTQGSHTSSTLRLFNGTWPQSVPPTSSSSLAPFPRIGYGVSECPVVYVRASSALCACNGTRRRSISPIHLALAPFPRIDYGVSGWCVTEWGYAVIVRHTVGGSTQAHASPSVCMRCDSDGRPVRPPPPPYFMHQHVVNRSQRDRPSRSHVSPS